MELRFPLVGAASDDSCSFSARDKANEFKPDLIFIACGADTHLEDTLSSLEYSVAGYHLWVTDKPYLPDRSLHVMPRVSSH